jgi:hypothetical protein
MTDLVDLRTCLIKASSCHDDTVVLLDLTVSERAAVQKVSDALAEQSTCDCQPTVTVKIATIDEVAEYTLEGDDDE